MNNKHVVMFSPGLPIPPTKGGAVETVIYEVVNNFKRTKATVISQNEDVHQPSRLDHGNASFIQLPKKYSQIQQKLNNLAEKGLFSAFEFLFVRQAIKTLPEDFDLLHIHNNLYSVPLFRKSFPDKKIVLHMHNDFLFQDKRLSAQYRRVIDETDALITVSAFLKRRIVEKYPDCEQKITVVHNGVNLERFRKIPSENPTLEKWRNRLQITNKELVFLYAGRVIPEKGIHVLVKSFRRFLKDHPQAKLVIAGSSWFAGAAKNAYLTELETKTSDMKDRIIFTGFVPHEDLPYLYNLSMACVVPSVWNEPFGLINVEAMACGCPVIAAEVGGITEIVRDRQTGYLTKANDEQDLHQTMLEVIENSKLRERIIQNAEEMVITRYSWSRVAEEIEAVYQSCSVLELR